MYWLQWSAGTCRATHAKWHPSRAHYWQYSAEPYFFLINDFHVSQFFSMLLKARNSMKKENPNCGSARYWRAAFWSGGVPRTWKDVYWFILTHIVTLQNGMCLKASSQSSVRRVYIYRNGAIWKNRSSLMEGPKNVKPVREPLCICLGNTSYDTSIQRSMLSWRCTFTLFRPWRLNIFVPNKPYLTH